MTSSTPGSPNRLWQVRTPEKREYLVAFSDLRTVPEGSMVRLGGLIEWTSVDNAILEGAKHEGQSAMPTSATFSTPQHIESDLLLTIDSQYASLQEKKNALALLKDKRALAPLIEKARAKRVRNYELENLMGWLVENPPLANMLRKESDRVDVDKAMMIIGQLPALGTPMLESIVSWGEATVAPWEGHWRRLGDVVRIFEAHKSILPDVASGRALELLDRICRLEAPKHWSSGGETSAEFGGLNNVKAGAGLLLKDLGRPQS